MKIWQLRERGYIDVPYPPALKELVQKAAASWERFCGLQMDDKKKLSRISVNPDEDFGYMNRLLDRDPKEIFDATLGTLEELKALATGISDPLATQFINDVTLLMEGIQDTIMEFCAGVEKEYHLEGFGLRVKRALEHWTFRFNHYFSKEGRENGDILAKGHFDRCWFTLHLFENLGGGQYYDSDCVWVDWVIKDGHTILFPGNKLGVYSGGRISPLMHRVVATPEADGQDRYSMIVFVVADESPELEPGALLLSTATS